MPTVFESTQVNDVQALKDHVIVRDMNFAGRKLSSGIIMLGDDLKTAGIRPRWAQVFRVGPDQTEVAPGQWILVEHGRWTRGAKISINGEEITIRRVDPENIIFVSDDEPPADDNISTAVQAQTKA